MKLRNVVPLAGIGVLLLLASGASVRGAQEEAPALAVVNGSLLTEADVRVAAAQQLEGLENERLRFEADSNSREHEIIERTLNAMVAERLIEAESAERGVSRAVLLAIEVETHVAVPTEADVRSIYDANRQQLLNLSLEEGLQRVRDFLNERNYEVALRRFVDRLKEERGVEIRLEPYRVDVDTDGFPSSGPEDARVTMVEFSDFECPFCREALSTFRQIEEDYGDRIRIVFRQFPLNDIHPRAQKAAEASLCANEQGEFWIMHDVLFAEPVELEIASLKAKAAGIGLDTEAFNLCLDSSKFEGRVQQEIRDGIRAGVSGTPTVFINGRPLNGVQPYDVYAQIIEEELEQAGSDEE